MELGILLIIVLWGMKELFSSITHTKGDSQNPQTSNLIPQSSIRLPILLLSLFLGVVVLQLIPLPAGIVKIISPKTHEIRTQLMALNPPPGDKSGITKPEIPSPQSSNLTPDSTIRGLQASNLNPQPSNIRLSFFPLATRVEFLKWLSLAGLFVFLLRWRLSHNGYRIMHHLIITIFLVGVFESLYGMFEFFTGHHHILYLDQSRFIAYVTGTFFNRNCFAGYLLMVIPLSIGFLFSREMYRYGRLSSWRTRLSSLDGKTLILGFGLILMILALLLSQSRAGIVSLLISFTLILLLFKEPNRAGRVSKIPVLIFGLALLWAAWIGLDTAISRFFVASEEFMSSRWIFWNNTFQIWKDFPLFGSGLGSFSEVYSMYRSFHLRGLLPQPENDFLQLVSEVGLAGVIPLVVLFVFLIFRATPGIRSLSPREPQRYIAIGGLVGILALMFHSVAQKNLQLPANAFLYTVIWTMVLTIALDPSSKRIAPKEQESKE
jgi:O-antigen ligase